jgi:hypothetical protein
MEDSSETEARVPSLAPYISGDASAITLYPLDTPLIQCAAEEAAASPSSFLATASGRRSAIVRLPNDTLVRLKGCGDDVEGFHEDAELGLRGCAFERTAARALYMTRRLREAGLPCANREMGFFRYESNPRALCVVFATVGDARLSSRLLVGLGAVTAVTTVTTVELQTALRDNGRSSECAEWPTATVVECGM